LWRRWGNAFFVAAIIFSLGLVAGYAVAPTVNGVWSGDWIVERYGNFTTALYAKTLYVDNIKYPVTTGNAQVGCSNGTWIAHGLPGDPGTTGSITLAMRGPSAYNATIILRAPTVLQSNATHFQIEFLAWETTGWTLVPVTPAMNQTIWWQAMYKP
jgi:hypothetical protein